MKYKVKIRKWRNLGIWNNRNGVKQELGTQKIIKDMVSNQPNFHLKNTIHTANGILKNTNIKFKSKYTTAEKKNS